MTDKTKTPATMRETARRGYRYRDENLYVTRIVPSPLSEKIPSPGLVEQPTSPGGLQLMHNDVLMGMTISFETPSVSLLLPKEAASPWPVSEVPFFSDVNKLVDYYSQKPMSSVEKLKGVESTVPGGKPQGVLVDFKASTESETSILSPCWKATPRKRPVTFRQRNQSPALKENQLPTVSPKSVSKTLRMQKVRQLGGIKGLRSELNRIRSPQSLGKPTRVARVLGDRLVN